MQIHNLNLNYNLYDQHSLVLFRFSHSYILQIQLGVIHILRNDQGSKGEGGFRNDYANVMFALSNAEFDYGRGRGSRNIQKVIT